MEQPKNPPAFPWNGQMTWVPEKGMTLRDYFAAKAMQAILNASWTSSSEWHEYAEWAYMQADAMLKERSKS